MLGRIGFILGLVLLGGVANAQEPPPDQSSESRTFQTMLQEQMQARVTWQIRALEAIKRAEDLQAKLTAATKTPEGQKP